MSAAIVGTFPPNAGEPTPYAAIALGAIMVLISLLGGYLVGQGTTCGRSCHRRTTVATLPDASYWSHVRTMRLSVCSGRAWPRRASWAGPAPRGPYGAWSRTMASHAQAAI
jgi:hypothetical protein